MAPSAIVVAPIPSEAIMQGLQVAGIVSLGSVFLMALIYGEIILLQK